MIVVYGLALFCLLVAVIQVIGTIRLSRHRGISRKEFVARFSAEGVPEMVPQAVYDFYTSMVRSKNFSIAPEDRLADLFSDEDDDLEDNAFSLLRRLGIESPCRESLFGGPGPIVTMADMVRWLDWARRRCAPVEGTDEGNGSGDDSRAPG